MKLIRHLMIPAVAALCLSIAACKKPAEEKTETVESDDSSEVVKEEPKPRGEEFDLVAKMPANKNVDQQIRIETQVEMAVDGSPQLPQQHNVTFDLAHTVGEKSDKGGYPIQTELVGKTYEFNAGEINWTFDSAQERALDGKNPVFKDLRKAVGGRIKYQTKSVGDAIALDATPNFRKSYIAFQKKATRSVSKQMQGPLSRLYSPHSIAKMLLIPNGLPDKPVAEGDTWTRSKMDQTPAGSLQAETTYTFEGWTEREGRKVAVVAMNTVYKKPEARQRAGGGGEGGGEEAGMEMEGEPGGGEPGGEEDEEGDSEMEDEGDGEESGDEGGDSKPKAPPEFGPGEFGKASGKIYFDPETGLIVEIADNQKFQISSTYLNKARTVTTRVKFLNKIRSIKEPSEEK